MLSECKVQVKDELDAEAARAGGAGVVVGSSPTARIQAAAGKLGQTANGGRARGLTVDAKDEESVAAFFEASGSPKPWAAPAPT